MIRSTDLAAEVEKFRDRQFVSGDMEKGVDCVNMLIGVFEDLGSKLPQEFEGLTRETYAELYQTDRDRANEIWGRFLMSIGEEVDVNFHRRGDILILKGVSNELSMAIALGNDLALVVTEKLGSTVCPIRPIKRFIWKARRLIT